MIDPTLWLQHHWCLYICWLIQLPTICLLAIIQLIFSGGSLTTAEYAHPLVFSSSSQDADANILSGKAILSESLLFHGCLVYFPGFLLLHTPTECHMHVVDTSIRRRLHGLYWLFRRP